MRAPPARFAQLALSCVHREYPNKIAHVLASDADVHAPRELTPASSAVSTGIRLCTRTGCSRDSYTSFRRRPFVPRRDRGAIPEPD
jgi:hypothetical protein